MATAGAVAVATAVAVAEGFFMIARCTWSLCPPLRDGAQLSGFGGLGTSTLPRVVVLNFVQWLSDMGVKDGSFIANRLEG